MGMTDPVADMLTRIRNAIAVSHKYVTLPSSKLKQGVAEVLKREGFIIDFEVISEESRQAIKIKLKYGPDGEKVINGITRESKPGKRVYRGAKEMKPVLGGTGICVVSTPKGILSDRECRKQNVGGEFLCSVW